MQTPDKGWEGRIALENHQNKGMLDRPHQRERLRTWRGSRDPRKLEDLMQYLTNPGTRDR